MRKSRPQKLRPRSRRAPALGVESLETRVTPTQGAFLQGYAFIDTNSNGHYDTGEGIAAATLQLYNSSGNTLLGQTTSDSTGYYRLNDGNVFSHNLTAGTYLLKELPPPPSGPTSYSN